MNVCFVIGCHPCWKQDYEAAAALYPDHKICAVNYAVELIKADYLATCHAASIEEFLNIHNRFHGTPINIYAKPGEQTDIEDVTYPDIRSHGGSGVFAAYAMADIFDLVIMCGCPITGGGGYAQSIYFLNDWHVDESHKRIKNWYNGMAEYAQANPEQTRKIRSLSGNTKKIFGGIDDN